LHLTAAAQFAPANLVRFFGGGAFNNAGETPLSIFEKHANQKFQVSDEEKEEFISLLGGL
jgi:hypothetical protein